MLDDVLETILGRIPMLRIAIVGDLFLDRYLDIDARLTEPSIETHLDAYQVTHVRSFPGEAGTRAQPARHQEPNADGRCARRQSGGRHSTSGERDRCITHSRPGFRRE